MSAIKVKSTSLKTVSELIPNSSSGKRVSFNFDQISNGEKMSTLNERIAQYEALGKEIAEMRLQERTEAISKARELITDFELTQQDLFGGTSGVKKVKAVGKVPPMYRDPVSKSEWSGRGLAPKWIKGFKKEDRKQFLIV